MLSIWALTGRSDEQKSSWCQNPSRMLVKTFTTTLSSKWVTCLNRNACLSYNKTQLGWNAKWEGGDVTSVGNLDNFNGKSYLPARFSGTRVSRTVTHSHFPRSKVRPWWWTCRLWLSSSDLPFDTRVWPGQKNSISYPESCSRGPLGANGTGCPRTHRPGAATLRSRPGNPCWLWGEDDLPRFPEWDAGWAGPRQSRGLRPVTQLANSLCHPLNLFK